MPKLVHLNVGGRTYSTTVETLGREKDSLFARLKKYIDGAGLNNKLPSVFLQIDADSYFIDRDGELFRFVLNYLQCGKLLLPEQFYELARLTDEARFYQLNQLSLQLSTNRKCSSGTAGGDPLAAIQENGYITVGYRGTFAFGRDGQADVKFRKLTRILICGKVTLCREVFGDTLNESRDPDRGGEERYTARLYLKHNSLERAFDALQEKRFTMISSAGSGAGFTGTTGSGSSGSGATAADMNLPRNVVETEEHRWNHYNEFVFCRNTNGSPSTSVALVNGSAPAQPEPPFP